MDRATDRGVAAAGQQQPQSPPTPQQTTHNDPSRDAGRESRQARKVLGWATGFTPTKMAIQEAYHVTRGLGWVVSMFTVLWEKRTNEAESDRVMAEKDPERFWDEMVVSAQITPQSLKSRYRLAYWMDFVVLAVLAAAIGFTAANAGMNAQTMVSVALCNLVFVTHMVQIHKLYIAREQRIISLGSLLKLVVTKPSMLIPEPLPAGYSLRQAPAPAAAKEDR